MENKNRFKSVLIAKRISYIGIYISIVILITCMITSSIAINLGSYVRWIYGGPVRPNPQEHFFPQVFPLMIISGISGLIIFLPLTHILNHKLKTLSSMNTNTELKLNQKLDSLKIKRTQEYWYLF